LREPRLLLATRNPGKIGEIRSELAGVPVRLLCCDDLREWPELREEGETFEDNALAKASQLARWADLPALADDSGLEVDALGGEPGVRSARFAGEHGDDAANIDLLLRRMRGLPRGKRRARFVCVLALASPEGERFVVRETCEGSITAAPRGAGGFGYDPVFVPEGEKRTMAELTLEEKNAISHRGKALRRLRALLEAGEPAWLFA
jgi:XTP/dITP diphosphohydrolase